MNIGEVCLETNDVIGLASFYRMLLNITDRSEEENPVHQFILTEGTTLTVYNDG